MQAKIGIDKLILVGEDFRVRNIAEGHFSIDEGMRQGGEYPRPLLGDSAGHEVSAWKMYHNGAAGQYTINKHGLRVQFNPSKLHHSFNLVSTQSDAYKESIKIVKSEMESIGLRANIDTFKINRFDLASQSQMNYPIHLYNSAFQLIKGKRMRDQRQYQGGYLIANNSAEVMFYDKLAELQHQLKVQSIEPLLSGEKNLLRCEMRAKKTDSSKSILGLSYFHDFNDLGESDLNNTYKSFLNTRIFSSYYNSHQLSFDFDAELEFLKNIKQRMPRGGWKQYLLMHSIDDIILKHGSIDKFSEFMQQAGYSRMSSHRASREIQYLLSQKARLNKMSSKVSASTLLDELHKKFAA